jgi:hypothetical protein
LGLLSIIRDRLGRIASEKKSMSTSLPLIGEWPLPPSATLGSSVRAKGIEREVRARLPWAVRKFVKVETGRIVLRMSETEPDEFRGDLGKHLQDS